MSEGNKHMLCMRHSHVMQDEYFETDRIQSPQFLE